MPYRPRLIDSLKIVENDNISYEFKYADRDEIDALFARREQCDDILIVKNGLITDTSYANILLKKGKQWFTPWSALLKGTMRTKLVEYSKVQEEEIPVTEISNFKSFKLINAMMEFDAPEVDISKIVL
jgi:4-amino-4-deoxychorismate lyase